MHFATLELHAVNPLQDTVTRLEAETSSRGTADLLNELVASAELAARQKEWPTLLRAAHSLIELETKGGEAAEHRGYGIALRRMLPRSALERLARLVASAPHRAEAVVVMRRMGADATEVLLHEMATAEDATDRRAYFNALKEMTRGHQPAGSHAEPRRLVRRAQCGGSGRGTENRECSSPAGQTGRPCR